MILEANKRDSKENSKALRKSGSIPAVVYGPKQEAISIKINTVAFLRALKEAGESTVLNLSIDGEDHEVLIQDVVKEAIRGDVLHADFYAIEKGKKVSVNVPLEFVGESPAEKAGGILVKVLHEIEIEAMPKDLPHEIEVSIESLVDMESQINVGDLVMPTGVTLLTNPEEVVILVQAQRGEEEEPAVEFDPTAVKTESELKKADSEKEEA
ncbi:MAG: 50S ribosomal protein L25 [Candidatus Pacebacteria bacterium]|nr:50S ribosomal protein L25 [Candidatus Paceibacterota bacterium]